MSSTADKALNLVEENLEQVKGVIGELVTFAQQEIPEVLYQLLMWHGIKSGITFVAGVLLIGFSIHWFRKAIVAYNNNESWATYESYRKMSTDRFDTVIGCTVVGFAIGILIICCNMEWLQILVAPKLYLIEYGVDALKTVRN